MKTISTITLQNTS